MSPSYNLFLLFRRLMAAALKLTSTFTVTKNVKGMLYITWTSHQQQHQYQPQITHSLQQVAALQRLTMLPKTAEWLNLDMFLTN